MSDTDTCVRCKRTERVVGRLLSEHGGPRTVCLYCLMPLEIQGFCRINEALSREEKRAKKTGSKR